MSTISNPDIQSRGILWGDGFTKSLWAQFADDAAIISDNYSETQLLINIFQQWTAWADLTIRPDKSHAYAAAQRNGGYQLILPTFSVNDTQIPAINLGEHMTYLGRHFSFTTDAEMAKSNLINNSNEAINFAHMLPITPAQKCTALNL